MQAEFARIRTESAANWRTVRKNIFNFDSLGLRFRVGVRVWVLIVAVEIQNELEYKIKDFTLQQYCVRSGKSDIN